MSYYRDTYIKSEHWQNLRLERLVLSKCTCAACGHQSEKNDVHHVRYTDSIWSVKVEDIRVLCRSCHIRVHKIMETYLCETAKTPQQIWVDVLKIISEEDYEKRQDSIDAQCRTAQGAINALWSPAFQMCVSHPGVWAVRLLVFMLTVERYREDVAYIKKIRHLKAQRDQRILRIQSGKMQRHDRSWLRWALNAKHWDDAHPERLNAPAPFTEKLSFLNNTISA